MSIPENSTGGEIEPIQKGKQSVGITLPEINPDGTIKPKNDGKGKQVPEYGIDTPDTSTGKEKGAETGDERGKKAVAEKLKEREKDVGEITKDEMEKLIAQIRKNPKTTRENAIILHTYAVQHMGVSAEQIGGIERDWNGKTWAILRKCQEDGIGGKGINVNRDDLKNIDWSKATPKSKDSPVGATAVARSPDTKAAGASAETPAAGASAETPAAVADETTDKSVTDATPVPPSVDTASVTETQDARDVVKDLTEKLGQTQFEFNGIPAPLRVDTGKIQIIAVEGKTGIYEVQSPDLGNVTKDKIYVDKNGRLVTAEGKTEDVKLNVSMPNSLIRLGSLFGNEDAKRLKEFIAKANVKDGEYTVSQSEGKVSLKLNESSIAKA